jgi:flagellar biosynthesis protein
MSPAPFQPKAAALKYDRGKDVAPKLAAKGRGSIAEKIIETARAHGVPVHQDADLVEVLEKVEIDTEIPLEVYAVVAEVFAYLYKVNNERRAARNLQGMK